MFFRYQRGSRSLAANLSMSQSTAVATAPTPVVETQDMEEDYDIPEEVETVIGQFQPPLCLKSLVIVKSLLRKCNEHFILQSNCC